MFDVLVYLYENYGALHACPDADSLSRKLTAAGFDDDARALAPLFSLAMGLLPLEELVTEESTKKGIIERRALRPAASTQTRRLPRSRSRTVLVIRATQAFALNCRDHFG